MTDAVRGCSGERPALPQVCSDQAGAAVLRNGAACVLLDPPAAALLAAAQREAAAFFDLPAERKTRHSSADENFGFRRMGKEYSISPDRPDVNDCFTLWSDRLKRVRSGVYRYPLCDDKDLECTSGARHHANVKEAIERGVPMRGFLVWPKKELNAAGQHGVEDADPTRQYEVEVESHEGAVVVALAKGM